MAARTCSKCKVRKAAEKFYRTEAACRACRQVRATELCRQKSRARGATPRLMTLDGRALRAKGSFRCPTCKQVKPLSSFGKNAAAKFGHSSHCRKCAVIVAAETHARNPGDRAARYQRAKRALRNRHLQRKYGITLEDYERLLSAQNGVCSICGRRDRNKGLAVDHDHRTGLVRDLLCGRCNPAIGFLQEDPVLARKMAAYLERHKCLT